MTAQPDPKQNPPTPKRPKEAPVPKHPEGDPDQPGACDATPGGRGGDASKPACPEGYPEEQQTDDPAKRPDRGAGEGKGGKSGETRGDRAPDQRER